jgi:hypothetical protein
MADTSNATLAFDLREVQAGYACAVEAAAEAWDRWAPLLAHWLGPATEAMCWRWPH